MVNTCKFPTISCRERGIDDERGSWLGLSSKLTCLESHQRLKCWMGLEIYATLYIYNLLYFYITFYTSTSSECAAYHGCTTSFFRLLVRGHGTQPVQLGHRFPLMLAFTDPSLVKPGSRIGSGYRGHRPCRILQGQSWL